MNLEEEYPKIKLGLAKDISNQKFNRLTPLYRTIPKGKEKRVQWLCQCDCGNYVSVAANNITSGSVQSCGCLRNEQVKKVTSKNEVGNIYGYLKVIKEATEEEKPRHDKVGLFWNCTCLNCGKENVIVLGDYLRNGDTKSCGCLISKNESKIKQMLDKLNISYLTQYKFDDLQNNNHQYLYFDLAIIKNDKIIYLIEQDGIQHFEEGHFKNSFFITHKNDLIKNKYCFEHNIPLIRIPYNVKQTEEDLVLETTHFLLTQEKEENYYKN